MKLTVPFLLIVLLLTILPLHIEAHPHNWINLKTEFMLDEVGQLTGLKQYWEFDIFYSTILLADIKNEYKNQQQGLAQQAKEMIDNLWRYNYFSELKIGRHSMTLDKPSEYSLSASSDREQPQLMLTMSFVLKEARPVKDQTLLWRVFDPSYYIDMKHQQLSQVLIHKQSNTECTTNLESPKPSEEMIKYATSLDQSQKDTQGLGSYFAEKILIHCS